MRAFLRLLALFACAEMLPLTRRNMGAGFCVGLTLIFAIKHQVLIYLPVSLYYQLLNEYAALAMAVHLAGRVFFPRVGASLVGVPSGFSGIPWLHVLGFPEKASYRYLEPLLVAGFAAWASTSGVFLRFRPLFRLNTLPLPYGIVEPYPFWYQDNAIDIAYGLPFASALALAIFNHLCEPAPKREAAPADPLTFSDVRQTPGPGKLPAPSADWMAFELQQEGNTP